MNQHFPDPPKPIVSLKSSSKQLVAPNEIKGTWVTNTCAEPGCTKTLGHWSEDGKTWKYPGAKCEKHAKGARK